MLWTGAVANLLPFSGPTQSSSEQQCSNFISTKWLNLLSAGVLPNTMSRIDIVGGHKFEPCTAHHSFSGFERFYQGLREKPGIPRFFGYMLSIQRSGDRFLVTLSGKIARSSLLPDYRDLPFRRRSLAGWWDSDQFGVGKFSTLR